MQQKLKTKSRPLTISDGFLCAWYRFLGISPVCEPLRFQSLKRMHHLLVDVFFVGNIGWGEGTNPKKKCPSGNLIHVSLGSC